MKNITTLFLLLTLSTFSATARLFSITAILNGNNVVPISATGNTGTLTGTFNDATGLLNYSITYTPLPFGRFHSGAAGTNGPQISTFSLNVNSPTSGTVTFGATDITNLLAGNIYVELEYSSTIKIRGQLTSVLIVDTFNEATKNTFLGIGGYSFTQQTFPNGVQTNPYVISGPSPQNDFSFLASAVGGITNVSNFITATSTNTTMWILFQGNNVRKFGCNANAINAAATTTTSDIVTVTATTNLGNTASQNTVNGSRFAGFSVTGGENEYIVLIQIQFQSTPSPAARIAIENIIFGDNTPQNVALNFDGVDDYVSTPSIVGNFGTNDNFTVTCWIKPDATQPSSTVNPDENDIISKWAGLGAGANNNYPFVIRYLNVTQTDPARRGRILIGQWDGSTFTTVTSTTTVNDGNWHHVAFVRGATGFSLYIDGTLQGTAVADNVTGTTDNTTPLQIGRRGNGQNYFRGEIDEVRIWSIGKTGVQIDDEKFCKTPLSANLVAFYNFNNGVPHNNNALISQVKEASFSANNGILNNFAKTGDASNFVTGQVKYVRNNAAGINNGSSWTNAFTNLQSALINYSCNNLFEVYVAKGNASYKPSITNNVSESFNIPTGMRIYGGFAGTEKSINQRNLALIHSTNATTLSGDLLGNDTPFIFSSNRTDNSNNVVQIIGSNAVVDGFTIREPGNTASVHIPSGNTNTLFKNNKVIDSVFGFYVKGNNTTITNSLISGNGFDGILTDNATQLNINNCLIANNGRLGVFIQVTSGSLTANISNSTIAFNGNYGIEANTVGGTSSTNTLKNTLIYGNASGGISTSGTGINNTITYSLVQGVTTGTGNLNGNTVNPQFVSPLGSGFGSLTLANLGDYRLKDSSPCINRGDDVGVSPFDLDRNVRPKDGGTDIGAYEAIVNPNEIISIITGNWESNDTWNLNRIPLATDKVIVNGHTLTVTTPNARAKNLEYKAGAILQYLSGGLLRFGL